MSVPASFRQLDNMMQTTYHVCVCVCNAAGNCWVSGTIPDTMQRLRNVTLINISNNWLNGTFPTWLANLTELRVLNLGSNQGDNEGSTTESGEPMLGLRGTIPPEIGQLTKLRELNLEANSLTGELPRALCSGEWRSRCGTCFVLIHPFMWEVTGSRAAC